MVAAACDGACWAAPAATVERAGHRHRFAHLAPNALDDVVACVRGECDEPQAGSGERGLTARLGRNDGTLANVLAQGAYAACALATTLLPALIVEAVRAANIRELSAHLGGDTLIVRADVTVRDLHLLEGDPHRLIEGILIACRATGVRSASVIIDDAAPNARTALTRALEDARAAGILDGRALGGDAVTIEVHSAAAGVVVEGVDLEMLCAATTIFDSPPPPTKLIALSGALSRVGLYEVPVDGAMTWAGVLAMAGVAPARVQALRVGHPGARLVLPEEFDRPLVRDALGAEVVVVGPDADLGSVS